MCLGCMYIDTLVSQHLELHTVSSSKKAYIKGHAARVEGKTAKVTVKGMLSSTSGKLAVLTIGKDDPTNAEDTRAHAIAMALQRRTGLLNLPFPRLVWLPQATPATGGQPNPRKIGITFNQRPLNLSQKRAVEAMLDQSPKKQLVVIHGGPGTGS